MDYKVLISSDAEEDLDRFIRYLLFEKKNRQAAANVLNDFEETKHILSNAAGSLKLCDNPRLNALGYRKIHFLSHRYFMLYRVEGNPAIMLIQTESAFFTGVRGVRTRFKTAGMHLGRV